MKRPGITRSFRRLLATLFFLGSIGHPALAPAAESILWMNSSIVVKTDGNIQVHETIQVRAEGHQIKRGIYRDFPTAYLDRSGNKHRVTFKVLHVDRNGHSENYHAVSRSNGTRVYIGNKDRNLPTGNYTYNITYITDRQIGFFEDHDELYWNVTGNGWNFPIHRASASVTLPPGVPIESVKLDGFTGPKGSREQSYTSEITPDGRILFEATRPLGPNEGLTIVVGWPKGYVTEPTSLTRVGFIFSDNRNLLIGLIGLVLILGYYLFVWNKVGRDPPAGTIIPRFKPPGRLSPAAVRYIRRMGFDNSAFAAAVIDLAVKGSLTIHEKDKTYTLKKEEGFNESVLSKGERKLFRKLFGSHKSLILKNTSHSRISGAIEALKKVLAGDYQTSYFKTNSSYLAPGLILSAAAFLGTGFATASDKGLFVFMTLWLTIWSVGVYGLWAARRYPMAVLFTAFEVVGIFLLTTTTSAAVAALLVILLALNIVFYHLLRSPTRLGRRMLDRIEGFRMYMKAAEEDRLNVLNPPDRTPELFETYLPYALALDVDQEWSERFSDVLSKAGADGSSYSPGWYYGSRLDTFHAGNFSSGLGSSLASAISSSSTAPGSSSGFSGGGSSGGGGGGGGGGGW